jgi:hypothetical protein
MGIHRFGTTSSPSRCSAIIQNGQSVRVDIGRWSYEQRRKEGSADE